MTVKGQQTEEFSVCRSVCTGGSEHKIVNEDVAAFRKALKCSFGRQRGYTEEFEWRLALLRSALGKLNLQQCTGLVQRES